MKSISVLGSTGSIGIQTLYVVRLHPDRFRVVALAAGSNMDLLERQVRELRPSLVSCATQENVRDLRRRLSDLSTEVEIDACADGLHRVATAEGADIVVGGLPGSAGLRPTFAAVEAGKNIALATKEVLVMAGRLFMDMVAKRGVNLLPVDSEQSAIFQCLQGNRQSRIKRILLTASGGPFRTLTASDIARVTREEALRHPRWKMGAKVSIDSATLMNKGLEVIEARWLFDVADSRIEVLIHPESIIHSMVEFDDGSILAQLGATDMRIPISYALAFPDRIESGTQSVNFPALGSLTFYEPDMQKFPLLAAAYRTLEDEAAAVALNAADEVAVDLFLTRRIPFPWISRIVLEALDRIERVAVTSLDEIEGYHCYVTERVRTEWTRWVV